MNKNFVNRHTPEEWKEMAIKAIKDHTDPFETTEEMLENFERNNSFVGGVITHFHNPFTHEWIDLPMIRFRSNWHEYDMDYFYYISYFFYSEEDDELVYRNTKCSNVDWLLEEFADDDCWSNFIYKGKNLLEWIKYDGEEINGACIQACNGELVIHFDCSLSSPITNVEFF